MSVHEVSDGKFARERQFHNEWARSIDIKELKVRESFEASTALENQYALKQLGPLSGKRILDLGCGAGECAVYFASQGADVSGCDIAEDFLKVGAELARAHGVQVTFQQAEAGHLPYADESFDAVFGNGVLHHVELDSAIGEVRRVLKKGGRAVFVEPLPYNPLINIYRHMAKGVRTEDEKPLRFSQLRKMQEGFSTFEHREFWLFSLMIFFHFYFIRRWNPSKVRYWKKVIEEADSYRSAIQFLNKIDQVLLKLFPFLGRLCWNTVVTLVK